MFVFTFSHVLRAVAVAPIETVFGQPNERTNIRSERMFWAKTTVRLNCILNVCLCIRRSSTALTTTTATTSSTTTTTSMMMLMLMLMFTFIYLLFLARNSSIAFRLLQLMPCYAMPSYNYLHTLLVYDALIVCDQMKTTTKNRVKCIALFLHRYNLNAVDIDCVHRYFASLRLISKCATYRIFNDQICMCPFESKLFQFGIHLSTTEFVIEFDNIDSRISVLNRKEIMWQ